MGYNVSCFNEILVLQVFVKTQVHKSEKPLSEIISTHFPACSELSRGEKYRYVSSPLTRIYVTWTAGLGLLKWAVHRFSFCEFKVRLPTFRLHAPVGSLIILKFSLNCIVVWCHTIRKCKNMAGQNTFEILLLNDANMIGEH